MFRYILIETLISIVINSVISLGFALLMFGDEAVIEIWGVSGVAADFIPQAFMVALMGTLVPTALTRRRIHRGMLKGQDSTATSGSNLLVRSLAFAVAAVLLFAGGAAAILATLDIPSLSLPTLVAIKIAFGAAVAAGATPLALRIELRSPRPRAPA